MKSLFILFLFSVSPLALAIDTGDGSDGACTEASFVLGKRLYQCSTLIISAPVTLFKGAGGSSLVIKVQGNVQINSAIDISGNNGVDGGDASAHSGGTAGPGGTNGGSSLVGADGVSASGSGGGVKGKYVADNPGGSSSYGGGGGGGSFLSVSATTAVNGSDSIGPVNSTAGANGPQVLTSESQLDSSFTGGFGGGAGGAGTNLGVATSGSSGGGGGGALRLVSGGNVTISANITADGGVGGGSSTANTGAGGGGSGGVIWIQAAGSLTLSSTLSAQGGVKGTTDLGNGDGGSGGNGAIRLDSGGTLDTTLGTTTPNYYHTSFTPTTAGNSSAMSSRQYSSTISCARVSEEFNDNHLITIILGFSLALFVHFVSSKKRA